MKYPSDPLYNSDVRLGDWFYDWMVIGPSPSGKNAYRYCRCICGAEQDVRTSSLRLGKSRCCRKCSDKRRRVDGGDGVTPEWYWKSIHRCADKRGLEVKVSREYIDDLFLLQEGVCPLSKVLLVMGAKGTMTASLDRIDSSGHYTPENVQWVHKDQNRAKGKQTDEKYRANCLKVSVNLDSDKIIEEMESRGYQFIRPSSGHARGY